MLLKVLIRHPQSHERQQIVDEVTATELRVYTRSMSSPCICTNLRSMSRKISAAYDAALAPVGLNIAQYAMLRRIESSQIISLTDLGKALDLERSTVGRNVKVLERIGAVTTSKSEADQREAAVSLTTSGKDLLSAALPLWKACQTKTRKKIGRELESMLQQLEKAF